MYFARVEQIDIDGETAQLKYRGFIYSTWSVDDSSVSMENKETMDLHIGLQKPSVE